MPEISYVAVLVAALSSFLLGGLWYSPALFGKAWLTAKGMSEEDWQHGHPARVFGGAFALSLLAAFVFGVFLGPRPELADAVGWGAAAGLCWVAAAFGINDLFEVRPLRLWAINAGYHTANFTIYGLVFGLLG